MPQLLSDDGTTLTIQTDDGRVVQVAKQGLSNADQFTQGLGGSIAPPAPIPNAQPLPQLTSQELPAPSFAPAAPAPGLGQVAQAPPAAPAFDPAAPPQLQPLPPVGSEAPRDFDGQRQRQGEIQSYGDALLDNRAALGKQKSADLARQREETVEFDRETLTQEKEADASASLRADMQESIISEKQRAYEDFKVDPRRFWKSKSAGEKAGLGLAIILGGIGQGYSAAAGVQTANTALQIIENEIGRDLRAQEVELDKLGKGIDLETNKLARMEQRFGNRKVARLATRQMMRETLAEGFAAQLQHKYGAAEVQQEVDALRLGVYEKTQQEYASILDKELSEKARQEQLSLQKQQLRSQRASASRSQKQADRAYWAGLAKENGGVVPPNAPAWVKEELYGVDLGPKGSNIDPEKTVSGISTTYVRTKEGKLVPTNTVPDLSKEWLEANGAQLVQVPHQFERKKDAEWVTENRRAAVEFDAARKEYVDALHAYGQQGGVARFHSARIGSPEADRVVAARANWKSAYRTYTNSGANFSDSEQKMFDDTVGADATQILTSRSLDQKIGQANNFGRIAVDKHQSTVKEVYTLPDYQWEPESWTQTKKEEAAGVKSETLKSANLELEQRTGKSKTALDQEYDSNVRQWYAAGNQGQPPWSREEFYTIKARTYQASENTRRRSELDSIWEHPTRVSPFGKF